MATGMLGANTDELRALAGRFRAAAETAGTAKTTTVPEVEGVEWEGPDADAFRQRYSGEVAPTIERLAQTLEGRAGDLDRQADEQDTCSTGKGGAGGQGQGQDQGYQKPWWRQGWQWYKNLVNSFKGPRFAMELFTALRNPGTFGKFLTTSWEGITGFRKGAVALKGIEGILDGSPVGGLYGFLKNGGDFLQGKWASKPFEKFLANGLDSAFGRESYRLFQAGQDGVEMFTRSQTMDDIVRFAGKEGRLIGKGLGVVGVGMDVFDAVNYAQHGQTGMAVYSGVKAGLGVASLIPGPVGWAAGGASLALAAYDNIPIVHDTVNKIGSGIKDGATAIAEGAKKLWPW